LPLSINNLIAQIFLKMQKYVTNFIYYIFGKQISKETILKKQEAQGSCIAHMIVYVYISIIIFVILLLIL